LLQIAIEVAKPLIDRALYQQDQPEIKWIQQLSRRLLTTTDLRQFLENVLTALCDLLRVETAFLAVVDGGEPHLEVTFGLDTKEAQELPLEAWLVSLRQVSETSNRDAYKIEQHGCMLVWNGYWLAPLRTRANKNAIIGVVGIEARSPEPDLSPEEQEGVETLLTQAVAALEDRQLQQGIFSALEKIIPEIEDIQRRRGIVHYVGEEAISEFNLAESSEFRQWVRDALKHYWGGPDLTTSPLMALQVVERATQEQDGNPMKGLRSVLREAIERLRPEGKRQMTAPAWLLYNILELKFLQGHKVREVAKRLAISESDLYRKQRVAIKAAARILAEMEREEVDQQNNHDQET
jgi:hypothetical protein